VCTIVSFLVVRIPLSYVLGHWYGVDGLMWAIVLGWAVGLGYTALAAGVPLHTTGSVTNTTGFLTADADTEAA
jgi:hypothetical protein